MTSRSIPGPVVQLKETNDITCPVKLQKKLAETIIMAQEAERKRLAQELHDNVNQLLATAKLFLGGLKTCDARDIEFKTKISQYIDMAFAEIRSLSHSLAVPHFERTKLTDSLMKIVTDIRSVGVFTIFSDFDEKAEMLDHSKKMNLFRIFQEQIKNTIRYSHATFIQTRLFFDNNNLHMIIKDNGIGFDLDKKGVGSGIYNICERAELCGGTATITTSPGQGCKLEIIIPSHSLSLQGEIDNGNSYHFA